MLYVNGKNVRAHRYSYELFNEKIKHGLLICHKCDNPPCVNPDHLFQGTYQDNTDDCIKKGRFFKLKPEDVMWHTRGIRHYPRRKGENHVNAKLTEKQVIEMIMLSKKLSIKELSNKFNAHKSVVSRILSGNSCITWY